jgi:Na+-transporting NADH:ubiquinone oxidoreductase subunit C
VANKESIGNVLFVAIGVSLVCSVLVASAAIVLKPKQQQNELEYQQRIVLEVAGLYAPGADVAELYAAIEETSTELASGEQAPVYLVRNNGEVEQVILPVEGAGLWGTMYGYLAVEADGRTARGLQFYQHIETPGLGDGVDKPAWQAQWGGKRLFDDNGDPLVEVVKGPAPAGSDYQIDGLAGATLTGRGVSIFVQHWISDEGYGPYLKSLSGKEMQ